MKIINMTDMKNTRPAAAMEAAGPSQPTNTPSTPSPDTRLSEHFTLREFTTSGTALRHGIDNTPSPEHIARMKALCQNVLEPMRRRFGVLRITSGFRCPRLNAKVGGVPTSQHLSGEAADIHAGGKEAAEKMFEFVRDNLTFDQLLLEHIAHTGTRWLHVSYRHEARLNRREARHIEKR